MRIVIDNIEQFRVFFDVVSDVVDESLELQLLPDRMICSLMDRGHTRFFRVVFDEDFFEIYTIDDVNSITVFAQDFVKLLKSCNKKDTLLLEVNDPYLVATIKSDNGNRRVFEFVLPSDFFESPKLPSFDMDTICECDVDSIKQSIKDLNLLGSNDIMFISNKNSLDISCSGELVTNYYSIIECDYESNAEDPVSSRFLLEYIKQIMKFDKINSKVTLKIGDNMPVLYVFKDTLMGVEVSGLIAPLLEKED